MDCSLPGSIHGILQAVVLDCHFIPSCCCSVTQSCPTLCDPMNCSMPGFPVLHYLWSLLKLMYIESMMPSNHLILCYPLLFLPSVLPSIRVFFNELALHLRWPKYWSFNISPSREYSGLISFRIDWLISFLSKGLSKSFLLCCNSKALIFQCSAFFMVQLSHPYMTTGDLRGYHYFKRVLYLFKPWDHRYKP